MGIIVGGLDLARNHFSLVLKDLITKNYRIYFAWDNKNKVDKWKKKLPEKYEVRELTKESYVSKEACSLGRYRELACMIWNMISDFKKGLEKGMEYRIVLGIEGYAYGASAFSVVPIAEMTGNVKMFMADFGVVMRIHDPLSIKLWAGNAKYEKEDMIRKAKKKIEIPSFLYDVKKNPASDIADAYFIMKMVEAELKVRADPFYMKKLKPYKVAMFNRTTKANPENLLSQPFIASMQPHIYLTDVGMKKKKRRICND